MFLCHYNYRMYWLSNNGKILGAHTENLNTGLVSCTVLYCNVMYCTAVLMCSVTLCHQARLSFPSTNDEQLYWCRINSVISHKKYRYQAHSVSWSRLGYKYFFQFFHCYGSKPESSLPDRGGARLLYLHLLSYVTRGGSDNLSSLDNRSTGQYKHYPHTIQSSHSPSVTQSTWFSGSRR